ncbi:galactose-6-phosphate isomerase subunit LacA [Aerococcus agrisoli]|uniref:Galactose-6-phosphate isomerase subunit LacA n=1 Tax=Aerococcus agrisoli TaxID=2487350 RepID=A0A3N4GKZ6_9LACT|nr:galactose-6-phosphate isomerase subunit LacA [Aerococcus agrisoli]RPA59350.1 galactose-6-phosphate isomerase subunit LacA [Aerococcus agrisoli]
MKIYLGTDQDGMKLKEVVKQFLIANNYDFEDLSETPSEDFVESTVKVAKKILEDDNARGILFDRYGAGSYISAVKIKGIIAAEVSDERSAYMTREHNNSKIITLGAQIVGDELATNIVEAFLSADYDGGRHQVRVDMLNAMC